ncbi:MAG TPA: M42 family metallopeptidase [bacterium]|jgi:endoglucanase
METFGKVGSSLKHHLNKGIEMELLKRLTESYGGSGYEDEVRDLVIGELTTICDTVTTDTLGSVIGFKKGKGKDGQRKKIMIAGHMDEIGFRVSHISDKGYLRISPAGGFDPRTMIAQRVQVLGKGKHKLIGVLNVAGKPIHVQSPEERRKTLEVSDFFVDLGMKGAEVKKKVDIGDPVIWARDFAEFGDSVTCKAMDNRIGCYVMIEAVRKMANNRHDIYAVGTVQEEVGVRGAQTAAYTIEPDIAIALDVTLAVDVPGAEDHLHITKLGNGVAIKIMDSLSISDTGLVKDFRALADKKKIPYQLEILPRGGTDAGGMQRVKGGSKAITLSIPLRYVHSTIETANKKDIESAVKLLASYLSQ